MAGRLVSSSTALWCAMLASGLVGRMQGSRRCSRAREAGGGTSGLRKWAGHCPEASAETQGADALLKRPAGGGHVP